MLHYIWRRIGARGGLQKRTVQISKRRYSPKAARGMPTVHLPSGTRRQGTASLRIMPFQHMTCHPEYKPAPPSQTPRGRNTKL